MMYKRIILLSCLVVMLQLSTGALAATWTNGHGDSDWCNSDNWSPVGTPTSTTPVVISDSYPGDIEVTCDAFCESVAWETGLAAERSFTIQAGQSLTVTNGFDADAGVNTGTAIVHIYGALTCKGNEDIENRIFRMPDSGTGIVYVYPGADVNVMPYGRFRGADDNIGVFEFYMSGGTLRASQFFIGDNGSGIFEMTGGTMYCSEYFGFRGRFGATINLDFDGGAYLKTASFQAPLEPTCTAYINLDDARIDTNDWEAQGTLWVLDINEGELRIVGGGNPGSPTDRADIQAWIDANQITGYDGTVKPFITEDGQDLVVTCGFTHETAYDPIPANKGENFCPGTSLTWSTGVYVEDHNIYFGTDLDDVNESATPAQENWGPNTWPPPGPLALNTTYYWRVDTVNDTNVWEGGIWSFTTTDGNAFTVSPEDGEDKVPIDSNLIWGCCDADSYNIYFSTEFNDVNNRIALKEAAYAGTEWDPCSGGDMPYATTYYWAIDKIKGGVPSLGHVWSFETEYEIDDPSLKVWYKLDEEDGNDVFDSSGHGNHGLAGQVDNWDPNDGRFPGCAVFDNDNRIDVPWEASSALDTGEITVSCWLKDTDNGSGGWVFDTHAGGDYRLSAAVPQDGTIIEWRAGNDTNDVIEWDTRRIGLDPGTLQGWHHWAFVKDENVGNIRLYFDGERVDSNDTVEATLSNVRGRIVHIGAEASVSSSLRARVDDWRLYNRALTDNEVASLFRGGDLELAWAPQPVDGAVDVPRDANLTWQPGDYTDTHDVYFGTSWDDVNNATTADRVATKNLGDEEYDPGQMELDRTYYWRIDEVNGPNTWKGEVWRFTVANFLIVDDVESYDAISGGGNEIFDTWDDGFANMTWSQIALEYGSGAVVHSGGQAMRVAYQNNGFPYYSEIDANTTGPQPGNLSIGTDWTVVGVKALTLFFHGLAGNAAEPMYVHLEDGSSNTAIAYYGDMGEDINDVDEEEWHQWDVALSDFSDSGVILTNVAKVRIGFGDRGNPVAGGSGQVFFDDIRLYLPRCAPWIVKPAVDFSNNCIVDMADIGIMAEDWLRTDKQLDPYVDPGTANLVGHWELDGDANDSSSYANHGTAEGDYSWVAGVIGSGAIDLQGDGSRVRVPDAVQLRPTAAVTATAWINYSANQGGGSRVLAKGADENDRESYVLQIDGDDDVSFFVRDANTDMHNVGGTGSLGRNEWIHLAGSYDGNQVKLYINGELDNASTEGLFSILADTNDLSIGNRSDANDRAFIGTVDDVRVYNRALLDSEIAFIATDGTGYFPLLSETNLYDLEPEHQKAVNFRDYTVLLESWLEQILWP